MWSKQKFHACFFAGDKDGIEEARKEVWRIYNNSNSDDSASTTKEKLAFCPTGYEVSHYTHPDYGFISSCTAIGSHPPYGDPQGAGIMITACIKEATELAELWYKNAGNMASNEGVKFMALTKKIEWKRRRR
jgi:hypothetical protein